MIHVSTDDSEVKAQLRQLAEPICQFEFVFYRILFAVFYSYGSRLYGQRSKS